MAFERYEFDVTLIKPPFEGAPTILDTAATCYIYTDAALSVLATIYAANTGGTTLNNPLTLGNGITADGHAVGYLARGAVYYAKVGTVSFPVFADFFPADLTIGFAGGAAPVVVGTSQLEIDNSDTSFRTNIYLNGVRQAKIMRYGSLLWDNETGDYIKDVFTGGFAQHRDYYPDGAFIGQPQPQNMNLVGIFPVFWINTLDENVGMRSLVIADTSQGATTTARRTGINGTNLQHARIEADINLAQWLVQGDGATVAAVEPDFRGTQAGWIVLSTDTYTSTSRSAQIIFYTQPKNYMATNEDGNARWSLYDDGGNTLFPQDVPGTIDYNGYRKVANCLTFHNDAGVYKQTTFAGVTTKFMTQLTGSETKDWASVADQAQLTEAVTVTGAALGMAAEASMSIDLQGLTISAYVSAANTVTVVLSNQSGGAVDLGSGTLRAAAWSIA